MFDLAALKSEALDAVIRLLEVSPADEVEIRYWAEWIDAGNGCHYLDLDIDLGVTLVCAKIIRGVPSILI